MLYIIFPVNYIDNWFIMNIPFACGKLTLGLAVLWLVTCSQICLTPEMPQKTQLKYHNCMPRTELKDVLETALCTTLQWNQCREFLCMETDRGERKSG